MGMNFLTSNKAIIGFLGVSSIVVAGVVKDFRTHKVAPTHFESPVTEEVQPVERNVASEAVSKVAQMYLPLNEENIKKINSAWEITRIVGSDEKVAFDKLANAEDSKKSIKIKMELIGNGIVRINNDNEQVYRVSLLSEFGTIALFKKMGNGFEILEAKKQDIQAAGKNLVVESEIELVLERALNQAKSSNVLVGNDVSGQVTLKEKQLIGLSVELRNPNGETQHVEIDAADLLDGGTFKADVNGEEVSGVVFNNGKDGYRLSFVTGPLAGAMLNFVTKDQMEKLQSNEEVQQEVAQQEVINIESADVQAAADKVMEERKEVAAELEETAANQVLTAEEVKATASENGFSF
jgi:hypothetical protein